MASLFQLWSKLYWGKQLNVIDIVILVFLVVGAIMGFRKGLLMEIISISAFFIAIILGIRLIDWGVMVLSDFIDGYEGLLPVISFAVIFIIIIIALHLLGKVLKKLLDLTLLGSLDDIAGSLLGIVKWALFISIFFWIYHSFGGEIDHDITSRSLLYEPITSFAPKLFDMLSSIFPFIMDFFEHSEEVINQQEVNV
ncbi:CvpA family protein [Reichenbachiella agarivorans]|uniref:CvpA family protein n=1 Tax=Reichenbachiella agarivorans TaxID=2979464 RepID=A0ABY6CT51_9BACT|nr:CvpA family protein [Reichenbachiella agarivorans]UXP33699.1 CvpA family protein [Reichenbachiella agarivorans]